jgi:hypothetical protein
VPARHPHGDTLGTHRRRSARATDSPLKQQRRRRQRLRQAFGAEAKLNERLRGLELAIMGSHPGSSLASQFNATWDLIVAPLSVSAGYDLLLGTRFMHHFAAKVQMGVPCIVQFTESSGELTLVRAEDEDERDEGDEDDDGALPYEDESPEDGIRTRGDGRTRDA